MLTELHLSRIRGVLLVLTALLLSSCGVFRKAESNPQAGAEPSLSSIFDSRDSVEYVPPGSRDVVSSPAPGEFTTPIQLRLFSEAGAEIYYSLVPFDDISEGVRYQQPILMIPPFSVWTIAKVGGELGTTRQFDFTIPPYSADFTLGTRLAGDENSYESLDIFDNGRLAFFEADPAPVDRAVNLDGISDFAPSFTDNPAFLSDPLHDLPERFSQANIKTLTAKYLANGIYAHASTYAPFTVDQQRVLVGIEFGNSKIAHNSFGPGADYDSKFEVASGEVTFKVGDSVTKLNEGEHYKVGDSSVEIFVPWSFIGALKDKKQIAVRAYAIDYSQKPNVRDRSLPVFINRNFDTYQTDISPDPSINQELRLYTIPSTRGQSFVGDHFSLTEKLVKVLPLMNRIPLYGVGTIPIVQTGEDSNNFSGVNSSDRGILSTFSANSSYIGMAQLLAHELAHYQNAGFSSLENRWLQEAMSEWSAERFMYKHFPPRAVYRYLYQLRVSHLMTAIDKSLDQEYLDDWKDLQTNLGYEKAYLFMALLDREVGTETIVKAFQIGFNQAMNSQKFKEVLEYLSGKNLDRLFQYWVFEGEPAEEYDPRILFVDRDGDGLMKIDEDRLGLSDESKDSNGDGISDAEVAFSGSLRTILVDRGQTSPVMTTPGSTTLLRLGKKSGQAPKVSFGSFASKQPEHFYAQSSKLIRLPATLSVGDESSSESIVIPLESVQESGSSIIPTIAPSNELGLLPYPPNASNNVMTTPTANAATANELDDPKGDIPSEYSAYDITKVGVLDLGATMSISTTMASPYDRNSEWGNMVIAIEGVTTDAGSFPETKALGSIILQGTELKWFPYGFDLELTPGSFKTTISGNSLEVVLPESLTAAIRAQAGMVHFCFKSIVQRDDQSLIYDRGGCLRTSRAEDKRFQTSFNSSFSATPNLIDIVSDQSTADSQLELASDVVKQAVLTFEGLLARPLSDRNVWPLFIYEDPALSFIHIAHDLNWGIYLSTVYPDDSVKSQVRYAGKLIDQIARIVLLDVIDRTESESPLWVKEIFVAWLRVAVLNKIFPTQDVQTYLFDNEVSTTVCNPNPNNVGREFKIPSFNGESMSNWEYFFDQNLAAPGRRHHRIVLAAMALHSKLGMNKAAIIFSDFYNHVPTEAEFYEWITNALGQEETNTFWADFISTSQFQRDNQRRLIRNEYFRYSWDNSAPGGTKFLFQIQRDELNNIRGLDDDALMPTWPNNLGNSDTNPNFDTVFCDGPTVADPPPPAE